MYATQDERMMEMGLIMDLPKHCNSLFTDFRDAYWSIDELSYDTSSCYFLLCAYPSRDARKMDLQPLENPTVGFGACGMGVVKSELYRWRAIFPIIDIFPEGIPLSSDEQKARVYDWVKGYTKLPFKDALEADCDG